MIFDQTERGRNPHLHVIATDGCFSDIGTFNVAPTTKTADVQELFRHEVFKMLKAIPTPAAHVIGKAVPLEGNDYLIIQ